MTKPIQGYAVARQLETTEEELMHTAFPHPKRRAEPRISLLWGTAAGRGGWKMLSQGVLAQRQRKAASWRPAAPAARPSSGSRRESGPAGARFDLSRIPAQAPVNRRAGLAGGSRKPAGGAKEEDLLSVVAGGGGGPRAVGAPEYYEVDGSTPTPPPPLTLSKETVSPAADNGCGDFDWKIAWKLNQGAPAGGFIVQKVVFSANTERCPATPGGAPAGVSSGTLVYWEAWQVNKGKKVTALAEGGATHDDKFTRAPTPAMRRSRGSVSFTAEALYYDRIDVAQHGFAVTGRAPAFDLPMTLSDPQLTGGGDAVAHVLTARWDCCATGAAASTATALTTL